MLSITQLLEVEWGKGYFLHHCINHEEKPLNLEEKGIITELLKEILLMIISEAQQIRQFFIQEKNFYS